MTDFMPESAWAEVPPPPSQDFWESTQPAPVLARQEEGKRRQRRPAAALGSDVNALLESMGRKRVPRLDAVRVRLQMARSGLQVGTVEYGLQALHDATTRLDFLAGRSGGEKGPLFMQQCGALVEATEAVQTLSAEFLTQHVSRGAVARLLWIEVVIESDSLQKRVRQAARWLAEMDQDLVARRNQATSDVMVRGIEELARRAHQMHERLQTVHRLCGHARSVHKLCEQLQGERTALCTTLQDKVLPSIDRLRHLLEPLLEAAAYRALVPTELIEAIDGRHELQVLLTQAGAQILRLKSGDQELASQLAWMEEKARRLETVRSLA
jgi:hypothetical protein